MTEPPASLFTVAIDPRTLSLVIAVNLLAIAVAVLFSARTYPAPTSRSMLVFGVGKLLSALGFALVALRADVHPAVSAVLGNALVIAGFSLNLSAVRILEDRPRAFGLVLAMGGAMAAGSALFTLAVPDLQALRIVTGALGLAVSGLLAFELLVRYRGPGRSHRLAGGIILGMMAIIAVRLADAVLAVDRPPQALDRGPVEALFFLGVYFGTTVATLNFILMYNDAFNEELRRLAHVDPLTGVANRRHLFARAEDEVRRSRRFAHPLSVLVVDVDHFKRINDGWGHAVGDLALEAVAGALGGALRDGDLVARLGGEEFVVLLPETPAGEGAATAERLRAAIAALAVEVRPPLRLTVSVGVAALRGDDADFAAVLRRADAAMYQAKAAGRDRVCLAPPLAAPELV